MHHLHSLVVLGKIVLSCPFCQSKDWKQLFDKNVLVCKICSLESSYISWVEKIKEVGDGDPYITLILRADKGGLYVTVDTTHRNSKDGEHIHFSTALGGMHSLATLETLTEIISTFEKRDGTSTLFFKGVGGSLEIGRADGEKDTLMKTENFYEGKSHGAEVFFPKNHEIFPYLQSLKRAMLHDLLSTKI